MGKKLQGSSLDLTKKTKQKKKPNVFLLSKKDAARSRQRADGVTVAYCCCCCLRDCCLCDWKQAIARWRQWSGLVGQRELLEHFCGQIS